MAREKNTVRAALPATFDCRFLKIGPLLTRSVVLMVLISTGLLDMLSSIYHNTYIN